MNVMRTIRTVNLTAAAVSLCVLQARAATIEFPAATGDLADPAAWGGALPQPTDDVILGKASGSYTASADLTFNSLAVTNKSIVVDLTAADRRVDLTSLKLSHPTKTWATFKGGYYDLGGGSIDKNVKPATSQRHVKVQDGCVMTNCASLYVAHVNSYSYAKFYISDGAQVFARRVMVGYTARENDLCIENGGALIIPEDTTKSPSFYIGYGETYGYNNSVSVTGEGSLLDVRKGQFNFGNNEVNTKNTLSIDNKASGKFQSMLMNYANSKLSVDNGASLAATSFSFTSAGGSVFIGNGATFEADAISVKANDGSLVVSNGTFSVPSDYRIGSSGRTNFTFTAMGERAVLPFAFDYCDDIFCENSVQNAIVLDDHAKLQITDGASCRACFAKSGRLNTLRVAGGASICTPSWFWWGYTPPVESVSNTLEVCCGGVIDANNFRVSGTSNRLILDDGLIYCTNTEYNVEICYRAYGTPDDQSPTNALVVIRGAKPQIRADNLMKMYNGATLRYEIPADGYAEGHCPIVASALQIGSSCKVEIECAEWAAKTVGGKLALAKVTAEDGLSTVPLEKIRKTLPENCRLVVSNKTLYLKTPKQEGLIILFK